MLDSIPSDWTVFVIDGRPAKVDEETKEFFKSIF